MRNALPSVVRRFDPAVLGEALSRAVAVRGAVFVFDLDSTLLDNRPRQARILRELGELHHLPALVAARPEHYTSWDLRDAMLAAGLDAAAVERWADDAKAFWRDRFFTSEYCRDDEAIAGAIAYVHAVANTGAVVAYCTGRHEAMRRGTVENFTRLGFPLPGGAVHLLMKPTFDQSDDAWKEDAYALLHTLGPLVAAFDNEPTHINGYRAAFPDALCVHLATDHSGRPVTLLDHIVSIRDFTR